MIKEFLNKKHLTEDIRLIPYMGIDATSDSLHIGHLLPLRLLKTFDKQFILIGTKTACIGDPTGRNKERAQLDINLVKSNRDRLVKQILRLLPNATILDNVEDIDLLDIAGSISVNKLSSYDVNKNRLQAGEPLTLREFIYPVLQAYDYLKYFQVLNINCQIGGSDQYCNILTGIDLIKNKTGAEVFGITTHLLNSKSGQKLGKTTGGLSIDSDSKKIWDFFRSIRDEDLNMFFERVPTEISEINIMKANLADEIIDWIRK